MVAHKGIAEFLYIISTDLDLISNFDKANMTMEEKLLSNLW